MNTEDYKKQLSMTKEDLLKGYYTTTEDIEKAISYLIFCTQLYCKKGGTEEIW